MGQTVAGYLSDGAWLNGEEIRRLLDVIGKLLSRLRHIALRVERLERDLTRTADDVSLELEDTDLGGPGTGSLGKGKRSRRKGKPKIDADADLRKMAEPGVAEVKLTPASNGAAWVTFHDVPRFKLPATLASLLRIVCKHDGISRDEFIGWKSWKKVATLLGKSPDKKAKHSLDNLVYRLRCAIAKAGGNRYWIETDRRLGIRCRIRREEDSVIE